MRKIKHILKSINRFQPFVIKHRVIFFPIALIGATIGITAILSLSTFLYTVLFQGTSNFTPVYSTALSHSSILQSTIYLLLVVGSILYFWIDYRQHITPLIQEDPAVNYTFRHHAVVVTFPILRHRWKSYAYAGSLFSLTLVAVTVATVLTSVFGLASAPVTENGNASNITEESVSLSGNTSPNGITVRGFEYGIDTGYGQTIQDSSSTDYQYSSKWGTYGNTSNQFINPTLGISIDDSDNIYVIDSNSRLQKFDSSGNYILESGGSGSGNGQFSTPSGLVAGAGQSPLLYIVDTYNNRIQVFTSGLDYISQWGISGSGNGEFSLPTGIAVDSIGNVYVADQNNNRIQKFDSSGNYITQWGNWGTGNGEFYYPQGIAIDSSDNIYITDSQDRIQKFDSSGSYISKFGSTGSGNGAFSAPQGISVDSDDNIYVSDRGNHRIQKFDSSGSFLLQWGTEGSGNGQLADPNGITLDSADNVYVLEQSNNRVQKFNYAINASITGLTCGTTYHYRTYATNAEGTNYGQDQTFDTLDCPILVAVPQNIVADPGITSIGLSWDDAGQSIRYTVEYKISTDSTWTELPNTPYSPSVTVGGLSDNTSYDFRIKSVDYNTYDESDWSEITTVLTNQRQEYAITTCAEFQGILVNPLTFAFGDPEGSYYLQNDIDCSDTANWTWEGFIPPGLADGPVGFIPLLDLFEQLNNNGFISASLDGRGYTISNIYQNGNILPVNGVFGYLQGSTIKDLTIDGLTVDGQPSAGNGAVSAVGLLNTSDNTTIENVHLQNVILNGGDSGIIAGLVGRSINSSVNASSVEGVINSAEITNNGKFSTPEGIDIDSQGNVYVVDSRNGRIQKFTSDGTFILNFGRKACQIYGDQTDDYSLCRPSGLAIDSQDNVFVANTEDREIKVFDSDGNYVSTFGTGGSADGQFYGPSGITVDSSDNIYVADSGNDRIQKFDNSGNYVSQFGDIGTGDGQLSYPQGVTVDSTGNIYVADTGNNRIQKFDSTGTYLSQVGSQGSADGQFDSPNDLAVDNLGNIYVADRYNERVQKFDSGLNYVAQWAAGGTDAPNPQVNFEPTYLVVNGNDVYVSEDSTDKIHKFDLNGSFVTNWGGYALISDETYLMIGGLTGFGEPDENYSTSTVTESFSDMQVNVSLGESIEGVLAGGLSAGPDVDISDSYSTGSIDINNNLNTGVMVFAGGLVGQLFGVSIQNSYSTTDLSIGNTDPSLMMPGGLIGLLMPSSQISNSFFAGTLEFQDDTDVNAGGVAGTEVVVDGSPSLVSNNYYDQTKSSIDSCIGSFVDDQSLPVSDPGNIDCTAVNTDGSDSNYFENTQANQPINTWNFDDIWKTNTSSPPTFLGDGPVIPSIPGAPINLASTNGNNSVALEWQVPASTGHSSITDYVIQYKLTTDSIWQTFSDGTSTNTSATVTNLTPGISYDFRVAAVNGIGQGSYSAIVNGLALSLPSAPTNLSVTPTAFSILLSPSENEEYIDLAAPKIQWQTPQTGLPLDGYTIEYRKLGDSEWKSNDVSDPQALQKVLSFGIEELANIDLDQLSPEELEVIQDSILQVFNDMLYGEEYQFRVAAVNSLGTGDYSDIVSMKMGLTATDCPTLQSVVGMFGYPDDTTEILDEFDNPIPLPLGSIILTQDIDCSDSVNWNSGEGWRPIGQVYEETSFKGIFDGNGFSITNLSIDLRNSAHDYQAAFIGTTKGATIKNVDFVGGSILGDFGTGSVVGLAKEGTTISNVSSSVDVTGEQMVGGIVGYTDPEADIVLEDITYSGDITGGYGVGGIVGIGFSGDSGFGTFHANSIDTDSNGNIYTFGNEQINKFDSDGIFIDRWGNIEMGTFASDYYYQDGKFFDSTTNVQLVVDGSDNIYATDPLNSRIQKFDANGQHLLTIGGDGTGYPHGAGSENGQFYSTDLRIAVDSNNNLYVLDTGNNRVQKFSSDGTYITQWGGDGYADGELLNSSDIFIDNSDSIYVSGRENATENNDRRIQKFSSEGVFQYKLGGGSGDLSLTEPTSQNRQTFDGDNNLYLLDQDKVKIFNDQGVLTKSFSTQFCATSISLDTLGAMYVGSDCPQFNTNHGLIGSVIKFSNQSGSVAGVIEYGNDESQLGNIDTIISDSQSMLILTTDKNSISRFGTNLEHQLTFDGSENQNSNSTLLRDVEFNGGLTLLGSESEYGYTVGGIIGGIISSSDSLADFSGIGIDGIGGLPYQTSDHPGFIIEGAIASIDVGNYCTFTGGIVGIATGPAVEISDSNTQFTANCDSMISLAGGIVGVAGTSVTVDNSTSNVTIQTSTNPEENEGIVMVGGIIGMQATLENSLVVTNSNITGSISILNQDGPSFAQSGGIAGSVISDEINVDNVNSSVDLDFRADCALPCSVGGYFGSTGGYIGDASGIGGITNISNSTASGDISVQQNAMALAGGVSGMFINNSVNIDDLELSGTIQSQGGLTTTGGLVGMGYASSMNIDSVEAIGDITIATGDISMTDVPGSGGSYIPQIPEGGSAGIAGGLIGALVSGNATINKTFVAGDVSSPIMAGGLVGASVGLDFDFGQFTSIESTIAQPEIGVLQPGIVNVNNSFVSGSVEAEPLSLILPAIPPIDGPDGGQIVFPDEPTVTFGGYAGGMLGAGINARISNSYVSGAVSSGDGGLNFDMRGLFEQYIGLTPSGTIPEEALDSVDNLFSYVETLIEGSAGGLIGIYANTDYQDQQDTDYVIQNTFVAGKVSSGADSGSLFGLSSNHTIDYISSSDGLFTNVSGTDTDSLGNIYVVDSTNNRIQKFDENGEFITKWGSEGITPGKLNSPSDISIDSQDYVYITDTDNNRIQKFDSSGVFVSNWGAYGTSDNQFSSPSSIAVDSADNIYVVDTDNNRIQKFDSNGSFIAKWGSEGDANGELQDPLGITVDSVNNVYVADSGNNRIQKFDSNGSFIAKWGSEGDANGELQDPNAIAVDNTNNLYVVDNDNKRIQKFSSTGTFIDSWSSSKEFDNPLGITTTSQGDIFVSSNDGDNIKKFNQSRQLQLEWGATGSGIGNIVNPTYLTTDNLGNIYVVQINACEILKFDSDYTLLDKWGSCGSGDGQFSSASGIAADENNNIYVIESGNDRVQKFDSNGTFISKWGSYGTGNGQFDDPKDIKVDSNGNIFVGEYARIQKFDSSGNFVTKWGSYGTGNGQFRALRGIAIDSGDNVFSVDYTNERVQKFTNSGTYQSKWGVSGYSAGQLKNPQGIEIDNSNNFYISEYGGSRVQKFNSSGTYLSRLDSGGVSGANFSNPKGITIDPSGNIYVAETNGQRIQHFNSSDTWVSSQSNYVIEFGFFNNPEGMATDSQDNIYVADTNNHRIQKYDSDGEHIIQWGTVGSGNGELSYPKGVAIDSQDNVYVADSNNYRIVKFASDGAYISDWGSSGSDDGQFSNPTSLAVDSQDDVYVVDSYNDRVQKFDSNGTFITKWGSNGSNNSQFSSPRAVAVDSQDNVYVTDESLNNVQKFDSNGTFITKWGSQGSGDNQFTSPGAITVDNQDRVYVSDSGNDRIQLFTESGEYIAQWGSDLGKSEFSNSHGITVDDNNRVIVTERGDQYANNIQILTTDGEFTDMFGKAGEESSDIEFHAEGSQDVQNTYYDKSRSQASKCGNIYDLTVAINTNSLDSVVQPSIGPSTNTITNCTPINTTGSDPNYFINNIANAPLDQWDFDTIWKTETSSYPTFIGSTLAAVDEPDPDPTTNNGNPPPNPSNPDPTNPNNPTTPSSPDSTSNTSDSTSKETPASSDSDSGSGEGTPIQTFEKVGNSDANLEPRVGFLQGIWTVKQLSSFNWLLVILLFILSLIYAYRAYRERAQRVALQAAVHRYNSLKTSMTNFINVIVHYLGTPLSIMKGATEMMTVASGAPHWAQSMLGHKLADFNKTTSVLGDKAQEINSSIQPPVASNIPISKSIKNPYIWLPLSVTVSIWLLITLLIGFSSSLTQSRVIIGLQALILVLVIVIIIFIDHYHELQKEIVNQYRQNMKLEETSISSRREYLETLSGSLNDDLESLKIASKNLPVIKPVKLFRNGLAMLGDMVKEVDKVKRFSTLSSDAPIQNLSTELDKLKPDIKKLASEKQITLNIDSDSEVRSAIQPEESNQLLMSIISNAIMFSKSEGTVSVVAKSGRKNNTITIQDHGEGIPADVLEHIYEPFTKGSNTEQYNHKGLGLNLHSNKVIVDKIGGSIDISSSTETVDSGTKVTLSLPAVPKDPKNIAPQLVTPSK